MHGSVAASRVSFSHCFWVVPRRDLELLSVSLFGLRSLRESMLMKRTRPMTKL
jgi:hypothetical protein